MKHLFIAALAATVTGCASSGHFQAYEGAPRADVEQARVIASSPGSWLGSLMRAGQTRISCVDGKSTGKAFGYNSISLYALAPEVVLAPGRHNLTVAFTGGQLYGQQTVWFDAEPGRTYYARHSVNGSGDWRGLHVQLQDKDSSKFVSRVMDKEPDPRDAEVPAEKRCRA